MCVCVFLFLFVYNIPFVNPRIRIIDSYPTVSVVNETTIRCVDKTQVTHRARCTHHDYCCRSRIHVHSSHLHYGLIDASRLETVHNLHNNSSHSFSAWLLS
ncbi:unnamed protein product [Ectocarpus sp. 12 AP-2014]